MIPWVENNPSIVYAVVEFISKLSPSSYFMEIAQLIREIPDFPKLGILFKDITPVLAHPEGLKAIVDGLAGAFANLQVQGVLGIESRGFIVGAPVARALGCGFIPARKPKKLPAEVYSVEYALEYGTDRIEMHRDAIQAGQRILVIDDLLATGGTASAAAQLIQLAGGVLVGFGFVVELSFLHGRQRLPEVPVVSLVTY
jgi:adenine phosphoribosyltransferase